MAGKKFVRFLRGAVKMPCPWAPAPLVMTLPVDHECCYQRVAALSSQRSCSCERAHFEHQFQQVYKFSYLSSTYQRLL